MAAKPPCKRDMTDAIGVDGAWQRRIFATVFFIGIPLACHNLVMAFFAPNVPHWCARPPHLNITRDDWTHFGLPPHDHKCSRYKEIHFNHTIGKTNAIKDVISCESWEYDESYYGATLLTKFELVCERAWFVSLSKSIFIAGYLFSVIIFGYMADRVGRRPAIATCNAVACVAGVGSAFATSFLAFAVARFFVAFGLAGSFTTAFVLLMEVVGSEQRTVYGLAMNFGWCIGFVTLPGVVYIIRDWFWVQILITLPFVCLLSSWWILPESPRWLLAKGKVERVRETVLAASKANGQPTHDIDHTLEGIIMLTSKGSEAPKQSGNVLSLLLTPGLKQKTLNIFFVWFVIAFVYFGISYNTNELAGDPYVNFALSGLVEIPAYLVAIFVIRPLGRRNPLAATLVGGGLACLLLYPLPQEPAWVGASVSLAGKWCVTVSFGIVYVFTAELFPTPLRNQGVGLASVCGRFGSILAPFVRELGLATHPIVPQLVFGVLSVSSGLLVLLLPETNHCDVPDTIEEASALSRKKILPKDEKEISLVEKV